jgi:hypothetical protein
VCGVAPNPVALGSLYTVSAANLGANRLVSVKVADATGTQAGSVLTDARGSATYVGQASVAGGYSVRITDTSRKAILLATCTFSAR